MKGLLLKEWYQARKAFWIFYLIAILFLAMALSPFTTPFLLYYPCLLLSLIPTSLQQMDEVSKWEGFCGTLPCSRAQVVSAKYLMGLFGQVSFLILTLASQGIAWVVRGCFSWTELGGLAVSITVCTSLLPIFTLPLIFKCGVAKGKIIQLIIFGAVIGFTGAVVGFTSFSSSSTKSLLPDYLSRFRFLFPCVLGVIVILYALSWLLSIRFYKKRDIG